MSRDFKFLRRNSSMNEEIENIPVNPKNSSGSQSTFTDSSSRPPLNTLNPKIEQEALTRARIDRTATKPVKPKNSDHTLPLRTPDKHGVSYLSKHRFGWANKNESRSNSTQSTPMKSVSKPPNSGFRSKFDWNGNGNVRAGNLAALYKGIPSSGGQATVVNIVEVPHFDLKEDPSFWMDHSVQVLLRVRPLNSMEKSTQGYTRCLKQESAQSITWIGQPETRFTFDHVACETVDQEMIFRMAGLQMVENCLSGYNSCMFAYGQAGSGKTHTMLGEIEDLEVRPSPHRGMTPRIFEFLFARIQAEEESRRDEKLKYNCKCSFLEIYNEQITDLIDPSSNNLMLREDVKKGVYVENLSEFEVQTVGDILKLLTQGSLNRKVAATNMNRESSRSHSVFTCVIESRWEKDSTTNLRFARLNLVDLAGSERQKTSGAEGERLKEAASINKSLSTLSHVIMILVDLTHGKPKHVPYRDSRLTFLLQDSLGGNSKTMIIANVSPSICCAADTLNTLKFAQRAKLIQNNAVVNEDSTGDVNALQHQIRLLKEELLLLIEAHQQECNEKEQEIILLLSELRGKTSTIAELEDKVKMAEDKVKIAKDRISKMSVCITAAFVIVNRQSETTENNLISLKHKDIQLKESAEMNLEKDALLTDQAALIEEAEKQIQSLRKEVTELEETCAQLGKKLSEEEQCANAIEQKLEDIEDNDILKTREKLSGQKAGVSTLRSCVGLCLEDDKIPERYNADGDCSSFDGSGEGRSDAETNKDDVDVYFVEDLRTDDSKHCFKTRKSSCSYSYDQKLMESGNGCKDVCERDATIVLLRLEIESALKSLKEVQAEMIKLHGEKEEMLVSKKQKEQGMKCLVTQLLTLQATVDNFEKQSELKMEAVNRKLGEFEQIVHEAGTDWCQMKEILEHEVGDAKIIAVQKAAEASCIFAKLEEAQDTMKEADIMTNGLLIANEKMKLDKEKLKHTQVKLKKSLQSINYLKDQQLGHELLAIIEEMGISVKTNLKYITAEEKERTIAAARLFRPKNPSFMVIMRPRDLCSGAMYVPVGFAKEYLISRDAELIKLQDCDGREWSVNFRKHCVGGGGGFFICGWPKFLKDKNLKEGDICIFELIKEENIVLKVSVFDSSTSFSKSNSSLVIRTA